MLDLMRVWCKSTKSYVLTNIDLEQCESDGKLHWSKHLHKTRSVHLPVLETGQGPCVLADRKRLRSSDAIHNIVYGGSGQSFSRVESKLLLLAFLPIGLPLNDIGMGFQTLQTQKNKSACPSGKYKEGSGSTMFVSTLSH